LSVHHITSLKEDFSKRLDNDNLITLCELCHRKAEVGAIKKEELYKINAENGYE
jgi:5-methylcytosine-specific restriction endonuclease McrA